MTRKSRSKKPATAPKSATSKALASTPNDAKAEASETAASDASQPPAETTLETGQKSVAETPPPLPPESKTPPPLPDATDEAEDSSRDDDVPTIDEVMEMGYRRDEADTIVRSCELQKYGPGYHDAPGGPAYLVSSPRPNGFMRIGRRFGKTPERVLLSGLSEKQAKVLDDWIENGNTKLLVVKKDNF